MKGLKVIPVKSDKGNNDMGSKCKGTRCIYLWNMVRR